MKTFEKRAGMGNCHYNLPLPPPSLPFHPPSPPPLLSADNSQVRCWDVDCRPGCKNSLHCFCVSLHNVSGGSLCLHGLKSITNLIIFKSKYQTTTKAGYYYMVTVSSLLSIFEVQFDSGILILIQTLTTVFI